MEQQTNPEPGQNFPHILYESADFRMQKKGTAIKHHFINLRVKERPCFCLPTFPSMQANAETICFWTLPLGLNPCFFHSTML